jgi:hypothetical protein
VQGRRPVGQVDRHRALADRGVERASRGDEGRQVGDRVAHAVALAAPLDQERLVEVARARRIDRDELEVAAVAPSGRRPGRGEGPAGRRPGRLLQRRGREALGHARLGADPVEGRGERGRRRLGAQAQRPLIEKCW